MNTAAVIFHSLFGLLLILELKGEDSGLSDFARIGQISSASKIWSLKKYGGTMPVILDGENTSTSAWLALYQKDKMIKLSQPLEKFLKTAPQKKESEEIQPVSATYYPFLVSTDDKYILIRLREDGLAVIHEVSDRALIADREKDLIFYAIKPKSYSFSIDGKKLLEELNGVLDKIDTLRAKKSPLPVPDRRRQ